MRKDPPVDESTGTPRVCVTGASGFVGSHVVMALLDAGWPVVASVRDPATPDKVDHLRRQATRTGTSLEIRIADMRDAEAVRRAVSGCEYVCHTAAVVATQSADPQRTIIDPAVEGTRNVFAAIATETSVQRVVMTSSVAAIRDDIRPPDHVSTEEDWNESATVETGPYYVAKRESERLAWEMHRAAGERYSFCTINPSVVLGPVLSARHMATSPQIVRDLLGRRYPMVPRLSFGIVDVRDVAAMHVAALRQRASGRHIAWAGPLWLHEMSLSLRERFPGCRAPTTCAPNWLVMLMARFDRRLNRTYLRNNLGVAHAYAMVRGRELLGRDPIDARESVAATAESLRRLGLG